MGIQFQNLSLWGMVSRRIQLAGLVVACILLWLVASSQYRITEGISTTSLSFIPSSSSSSLGFDVGFPIPPKDFLVKRMFPNDSRPSLCILTVGCGRPALLNETLYRILHHMEQWEPGVAYETVLIEQSMDAAWRVYLSHAYQLDQRLIVAKPKGVFAWAYNVGIFTLCTAPHVLLLEDDWWVVKDVERHLHNPRFVEEAIQLVDNMDNVTGVLLREEKMWYCDANVLANELHLSIPLGKVRARICKSRATQRDRGKKGKGDSPGVWWGGYTNGAALYSMSRLRSLGPQKVPERAHGGWGEYMIAQGAAVKGWGNLRVRRWRNETALAKQFIEKVYLHPLVGGQLVVVDGPVMLHAGTGYSTHRSDERSIAEKVCKETKWK